LVQEDETDRDRLAAAHPLATRKPEAWRVQDTKGFLLGRFRITAVDCIYTSKIHQGAWAHDNHETIAEVLRWIAPIVRHVRMGDHDGTETVITPSGKTFERPRGINACGAAPTGADYAGFVSAKSDLVNGDTAEMCPACRAKLEAAGVRDLSKLSARRGSSTDKQRDFVRRLLDEGARNGRPYLIDARTINQMSSRSASAAIDELKALKARGWKGDL